MPTPSKKLRPFMAYIDESQHKQMTRLSKKINMYGGLMSVMLPFIIFGGLWFV